MEAKTIESLVRISKGTRIIEEEYHRWKPNGRVLSCFCRGYSHILDVRSFFDEACEFIEVARKANSNILVHCTMGMSRSSTIVIAYLMKFKGMRLSEAMAFYQGQEVRRIPEYGFHVAAYRIRGRALRIADD